MFIYKIEILLYPLTHFTSYSFACETSYPTSNMHGNDKAFLWMWRIKIQAYMNSMIKTKSWKNCLDPKFTEIKLILNTFKTLLKL